MTPVALVRDAAAGDGAASGRDGVAIVAPVTLRRASASDVAGIVALVGAWAAEGLLLSRSAADVTLALDDFLVAVDGRGRVLACAAVREYSPSLAEVVSVAVDAAAHGRGLGRRVVRAAETLASLRGHRAVFAHTLQPDFFAALGYEAVDRGLYPEKRARPQTTCFRRTLSADALPARAFAAAA